MAHQDPDRRELGGAEIAFNDFMPVNPGAELIGCSDGKVWELADALGFKAINMACKTGLITPHFSADQWQQIALIRGENAPQDHRTMSAMARTAGTSTYRMKKIINELSLTGELLLTTNGHQADHFSPEQYQEIVDSLGIREQAPEGYLTVRGLRGSLGASRFRINQIIEDFDMENHEMLMPNGRTASYYSPEDCKKIEEILNLWRNGGSLMEIVEKVGTSPLITSLIMENPSVTPKGATEPNDDSFFSEHVDTNTVQRFMQFRRSQKVCLQKLQERYKDIIPLSYFAAKNSKTMADVMTLTAMAGIEIFRVKLNEKVALICSKKDQAQVLEEAMDSGAQGI